VLVIEEGRIAHDISVDLKRPRERGSADLAALEGTILRELLGGEGAADAGSSFASDRGIDRA
jgi:sulfonate transport system ATP-binding protein